MSAAVRIRAPRAIFALLGMLAFVPTLAAAQVVTGAAEAIPETEADAELAQQLANPLAALVSVTSVFDAEGRVGAPDGRRFRLQVQPIVPFQLGRNVKVVTRTIVPLLHQAGIRTEQPEASEQSGPRSQHETGIGDVVFAAFFAARSGPNVGVGPVVLLPTATRSLLGTRKLGLGPSAAALDVRGPITYGLMVNHLWSLGGVQAAPSFSRTTLQPFLAYTTQRSWTFTAQLETLYEWHEHKWSLPAGLLVSKLTRVAGVLTAFGLGARYWPKRSAEDGPHGVSLRAVMAFVLPNRTTEG